MPEKPPPPVEPQPPTTVPPLPPASETPWYRKALLEILIIIIGILLSVIITEVFSNWKDNEREKLYLREIVKDVESDLIELEIDLDLRTHQLKQATAVLLAVSEPGFSSASLPGLAEPLKILNTTVDYYPNMATFRALESTGRVELISNDAIVRGLITLYNHDYGILRQNNEDVSSYRNKFLLPFLVENTDFSSLIGADDSGKAETSDALDVVLLKNHLIYNQLSLSSTISAYKRAMFQARATLKLVSDELE